MSDRETERVLCPTGGKLIFELDTDGGSLSLGHDNAGKLNERCSRSRTPGTFLMLET